MFRFCFAYWSLMHYLEFIIVDLGWCLQIVDPQCVKNHVCAPIMSIMSIVSVFAVVPAYACYIHQYRDMKQPPPAKTVAEAEWYHHETSYEPSVFTDSSWHNAYVYIYITIYIYIKIMWANSSNLHGLLQMALITSQRGLPICTGFPGFNGSEFPADSKGS